MHGLLRGLRAGRARQRAREGAVRPIEPSPGRGGLQGVRAGAARGLLDAIGGWRGCCRARRGCCDRARSTTAPATSRRCARASRAVGAEFFTPRRAGRPRAARAASSCPASATSARRRRSTTRGARAIRDGRRPTACRCSASASACSGCSRAATRRRTSPASALLTGRCTSSRRRTVKVPHVGWNTLDVDAAVAPARRRRRRHAGLLHALLRRAGHRRLRGHDDARRDVRLRRRARPRVRRAVSSGEVRRRPGLRRSSRNFVA